MLNLGAYKGESSVWLASQAGPSRLVLAFEPNLDARAFLERDGARVAGASIGQIQILAIAAGSVSRRANFISTAEGCSRLEAGGDMAVDVTTVDDVVSERRLASVDFIKMHIEGGRLMLSRVLGRRFSGTLRASPFRRTTLPEICRASSLRPLKTT